MCHDVYFGGMCFVMGQMYLMIYKSGLLCYKISTQTHMISVHRGETCIFLNSRKTSNRKTTFKDKMPFLFSFLARQAGGVNFYTVRKSDKFLMAHVISSP